MTSLSDQLNAAAGGPAAAPPPLSTGGSLTDKLNNAATTSAALPPASQDSSTDNDLSWHNVFNPRPADLSRPQTWTDWLTRTYDPSMKQVGTAALDDASFGTADYAQSKISGEDLAVIRKRTADAQAALGPGAPLVNAATYLVPGAGISKVAGKVAPVVGRYGAAALTGATGTGASEAGHELGGNMDPWRIGEAATVGAGVGVGGQAIGDALAPVVQRISDYTTKMPGKGSEQWDWRTRAVSGDPTLPSDVNLYQKILNPNDPAQPALAKTQAALAQSTEPGVIAGVMKRGAMLGGGLAGFSHLNSWLEGLGGASVGESAGRWGVDPVARTLNAADRNINVGQSLDQLYPKLYGTQSTSDVSGLAPAIRDTAIGAARSKRFGLVLPQSGGS